MCSKYGYPKVYFDEVHKIMSYVPVLFVYCSAHNLNLLINDAAEATIPVINFFRLCLHFFPSLVSLKTDGQNLF